MNNEIKFCKHCGAKISQQAVICPSCGCQVEEIQQQQTQQPNIVINNSASASASATAVAGQNGKPKSKIVALLLCILGGCFGLHKFYEGKIGMGILYLFTGGLLLVGVIIDLIALIGKPSTYYV